MTKRYNTIVYIGRFQPLHLAHVDLIQQANQLADRVIIVIGSANQPRTYKNPWTVNERKLMISAALRNTEVDGNYCLTSVEDSMYNDQAWATRVQAAVARYSHPSDKVAIIGHDKDESTFYLKMFPQWERVEVPLVSNLNATDIRAQYFVPEATMWQFVGQVPNPCIPLLETFRDTAEFSQIIAERRFIEQYKQQFAKLPYPPVFVTVDAVVIQSGHVLMIRRRSEPGKGLWALPGGFLNADTDPSVQYAMLRELREETKIKVPTPVLQGSIQKSRVFDARGRSTRGRTITHAFHIQLPDGELPKVRGSDDAEKAMWIPLNDVQRNKCYEDHFEILNWAIGAV